ncbi:phage baseplate assembly protein V [Kistimonas scapharcae]|uniref:Phage baseplate assembly protein V n=1 Tax=Kistimonas scapharcae TaxID=1036133 RepID=A0ABP8V8C1_9GAMM
MGALTDIQRLLNRALMPLQRRLRLLAGRAVVTGINDQRRRQNLQLKMAGGEVAAGVPRVQNYGHTSVPLTGAEALVLAPGGVRGQLTVVALDDPRNRPTDLTAGDSCLYHHEGHRLLLTRDGRAVLICNTLEVQAAEAITFDTPLASFTGDVAIGGDQTVTGVSHAADHDSGGISGKTHLHGSDGRPV